MKIFIINEMLAPEAENFLKQHGMPIPVPRNPALSAAECCHADMQFTKIDDVTLVCAPEVPESLRCRLIRAGIAVHPGSTALTEKYPGNIAYNLLRVGAHCFHHTKYTDPLVHALLSERKIQIHAVRQGYTGCSSVAIPVSDGKTLLLSSDQGVISAAETFPEIIPVHFTDTPHILLEGCDHGFIGGCCGYDRQLGLLLYGKINRQLSELSAAYHFQITSIYDGPLTDIGGILIMYPAQQAQD